MRSLTFMALLLALCLQACQVPTNLTPPAPVQASEAEILPRLVLDVPAVTAAVAKRPNTSWQDGTFSGEPFRSAREAEVKAHPPRYRTQAVGVAWSRLEPGAISSTPAFARWDNQFDSRTTPDANDLLYAILDNGTLQKISPAANTLIASQAGFGPVSKSGLVLSGDNRVVYVLTTTGYFHVVRTSDLTSIWSQKISQTGFAGRAPFIDYSNGGGFPLGADENVYAMSQDGSLYRVRVKRDGMVYTVTCNAYPRAGGTDAGSPQASWNTTAALNYGGAMTPGTWPVVWGGRAYVGDNAGTFYRIVTNQAAPASAPTVNRWNLTGYTSATGAGRACSAPASFDFDYNTLQVNKVFVPFGDRVAWINPDVATPVAISPPLVVDKRPAAANYNGALTSFPYTTATLPYTAMDWACIADAAAPTPSRWGSGSAVSGSFSTGISCATIKRSPLTGNMWCGQYINPGKVQALSPAGAVIGTYTSNTANCNEICFDSAGNCYAAHGSSRNITKFNPAGNIVQTFVYPSGAGNALWPETDASGNLWCTGASGRLVKFSPAGAVLLNVAVPNSFSLAINQTTGDVYVCRDASPGRIYKYNNAGTLQAGWPKNVGNGPKYVAIEPGTGNIWTANYNSNTVTKLSPAGVTLGTYATAANPWAIAFDGGGLPWVSCLGPDSVTKMSLTGATIATYTMPGSGNPYEIAFDGNGDCWVSCANGTYKLYDLGNLGDLFTSNHFGVIGDGDDSYSFLKFRVTANAYARRVPVGARVSLVAATTSITGAEDYNLFASSPYLTNGSTPWQGWGRTINADWNTRPPLQGAATSTQTGVNPIKDATTLSLPFTVDYPIDQTNTTDGTGGVFSYALNCSSNKVLKNLAHWYSNTSAPGGPQRPTLTMTVANGTVLPNTNGIQCQATFGLRPGSLLVSAANTLFELDIDDANPRAFADASKVVYSLTAAGRAGGPVSGGQYLYPRTNVLVNYRGDIFVADQDASNGRIYANRFSNDFNSAPTANHLVQSLNCNPGTGTLGQCMIFDYDRGSLYLTTSNNYLLRVSLF